MKLVLQSLYFMLPAYVANMSPVLFKWVPFGGTAIHAKIFGSHKTYRGILTGIIMAIATTYAQAWLGQFSFFKSISILSYPLLFSSILFSLGFLFGAGAMLGDLAKSFFKRRLGILEGKPWVPFDQLDFVIGALLLVSIVYRPPWTYIVIIILVTPLLHLITNIIAYVLRLKRVWW